jgi:hypothetical protein
MGDCEMPSVYSHNTPTARREHKCCECGYIILHGEQYHVHRGVWDGRGATYKVCSACEDLRGEIQNGMRSGECVPFEYLYDDWVELDENFGKRRADFLLEINSRRKALAGGEGE